ncbi:MAG: RNA-binding protein [Candidatus Cloacimonetes bacterium]|jgi:hypothetical protein|nr:RNA-binding protein [Candidatus Cloacimonadota bacterium]MBT6994744.1 RNA-binding protein [Candidatus Cloacimonadota bacterium]MBT7469015.1 RNA-binding protein [Candidatus Cloacimonadota bacterium]
MNIFLGSLPKHINKDQLVQLISDVGEVGSFELLTDKLNNIWRTFAIVDVLNNHQEVIDKLDAKLIDNNVLTVHIARWRTKDRRSAKRGGGRRIYDSPPNHLEEN